MRQITEHIIALLHISLTGEQAYSVINRTQVLLLASFLDIQVFILLKCCCRDVNSNRL